MASGQQNPTQPMTHPELGPAVAIANDRTRSLGSLCLGLAFMCLGPLGLIWGNGDLASGSTVIGLAYVFGGAVLFLYGVRSAFLATLRLRNRVPLVVGRDGFEAAGGDGRSAGTKSPRSATHRLPPTSRERCASSSSIPGPTRPATAWAGSAAPCSVSTTPT